MSDTMELDGATRQMILELKKAYNKLEKDLGEIYLEGSPITNIGDNDLSAPINADLCRLEKIINSLV